MKGTRKLFSIITALALCLSLLPGTAWAAEGDAGVSISGTALVSGKQYVAGEGGVVEKTEATPADTPYLDYRDGVLTVHGQMRISSKITITGNVEITGGGDSCLEAGSIYINGTLTLSGSMDFKPESLSGNYSASQAVSKLTTADDYSGDIAIQGTSTYVLLDVQSSASISIGGAVDCSTDPLPEGPMTLKSAGDISTDMLVYHTVTIAGKNVSLKSFQPAFWGDSLTIQAEQDVTIESSDSTAIRSTLSTTVVTAVVTAGGNVTISSYIIPVYSEPPGGSLTVENAKSVSIQGKTDTAYDAAARLLPVPVTFENCGSVTVTDTGNGEILKEGVPVTSDCPWTAKTGGKTVTIPSGTWTNGGDAPTGDPYFLDNVSGPTCYKAGAGWMFYEPPASGGAPAKLTLDGASYNGTINIHQADSVQLELKDENEVTDLTASDMTLTGNGSFQGILYTTAFTNRSTATLNAVVGVKVPDVPYYSSTVYGKYDTSDSGDFYVREHAPLTIAEGAVLTVDTKSKIILFDGPANLTNNGTIINNGVVEIHTTQSIADADISAFIKGLKLTGTGTVTVEKANQGPDGGPVTDTYTNSGTKLLTPAGDANGKLDLSNAEATDANWADQGYKWEVTKGTDDSGNEIITSAKLTLAPGFNATSVALPDTTVTIETTGESRIGSLTFNNPQKTGLTFSGTGPLTVDERINLAGGAGNTITVAVGAKVTANNGIYVGATGESSVTVNGILKATGFTDNLGNSPAVSAGKVEVSDTGVLEVSGAAGVLLNGMSGVFTNLFAVTGDGRFTANCSEYNVQVVPSGSFPEGTTAEGAINLGDEYMPDDCKAELKDGKINLVRISTGAVYSGALTIHKNHTWETGWDNDENTHWHPCEFAGCTEKQPGSEAPHYYAHGAEKCRDCEYPRPAGTPDSDSGSSGGDSGGSSGGSSGGGSSETTYTVTVEKAEHGKVVSDRRTASRGRTVTLTVSPDEGYETGTLTVTDSRGNEISLTDQGDGKYTFLMPGRAVTVKAAFISSACTGGTDCPSRAFSDLDTGKWYHEATDFVLQNGLMVGYENRLFGPDNQLTRAQFAQILHNREGRPVVNYLMQFVDVSGKEWYAEAVRWAASEGVVSGYGNGMFGPDDNITREQLAVMLWRYAGSPAATEKELEFADTGKISDYAMEALQWAVENGIVTGRDGGVLDPQGQATRAEAAAMLMRYLG